MSSNANEVLSLDLTPSWSASSVLTAFVAVSLLMERSIHWLCSWLRRTNRKPLLAVVEKMKEELMLLGFISLLLTATASAISNICIPSRLYESAFDPCSRTEIDEEREEDSSKQRKLLAVVLPPYVSRRVLYGMNHHTCNENHESFVSHKGLEQLHRFIFVMAVTHIVYSCLTLLLAFVKIHRWRKWENEARHDAYTSLAETNRDITTQRQSTSVGVHASGPFSWSSILLWLTCFIRQFGYSVVRNDYLTLRKGFITVRSDFTEVKNEHSTAVKLNVELIFDFQEVECMYGNPKVDSLCYMIRSMEEEFQSVFGVSGPLWCFVVAFMLFNVKGSNLYFWIASIPITLVLIIGTKLAHVISTLVLESGLSSGAKLKPRDELFWFNKPEILLSLIHFILFQNAFELASFFWFWWQFGYNSCYIRNHKLVFLRLILGFLGQFLCSYSTLPLYALVTQMGSNYKAALIPQTIRETIHIWGETSRRRKKLGIPVNRTVMSAENDSLPLHSPRQIRRTSVATESRSSSVVIEGPFSVGNSNRSRVGSPLRPLRSRSASLTCNSPRLMLEEFERSSSRKDQIRVVS